MGCFLACFGGSKRRTGRREKPNVLPRNANYDRHKSQLAAPSLNVQACSLKPLILEPQLPSYDLKPIATDYQIPVSSLKAPTDSFKPPTAETQGSSGLESRKRTDKPGKTEAPSSGSQRKVKFDLQVNTYLEISNEEESKFATEEGRKEKPERETEENKCKDDCTTSSVSYPVSHRYGDCRNDDYEDDDIDDDPTDDDFDDDEEEDGDSDVEHGELFEWYSASSFESEPKSVSPPSTNSAAANQRPTMAVSHARDRSRYVHPVLNPIENASQWKALKSREARSKPILEGSKENIPCEQDASVGFNSDTKKEMRVDASLSNWLSSTDTTTGNLKDGTLHFSQIGNCRVAFGALTGEKVNRMPPQGSEYQSPVGNCSKPSELDELSEKSNSEIKGIPNSTSKYREDQRVTWHSTPFEVRLARALGKG
ncbi:unnamed protein product [Victoria cruziana]